jgi:hypothetical protein
MAPIENINVGEMTVQARALDLGTWQQSKCSGKRLQAAAAVRPFINDCAMSVCTNVHCIPHHFNKSSVNLHGQTAVQEHDY